MTVPRSPNQKQRNKWRARARRKIAKIGWQLFLAAQHNECSICGKPLIFQPLKEDLGLSVDHVHSFDGFADLDAIQNLGNLLLTHRKCNSRKGHKPPTQREIWMLDRVNRLLLFNNGDYNLRGPMLINWRREIDVLSELVHLYTMEFDVQISMFSHIDWMKQQLLKARAAAELLGLRLDDILPEYALS